MARYQETKNYIWCTKDRLGAGATAVVFKGVDKRNGQSVAVKTFFKNCEPREIRVLQTINHKNIVKLLKIDETSDGSKVIIMELCTNNLSNLLKEPENAYGLDDSEFLLVLRDLYDGIKYLRDNNLIHRDLKPDNIMKCILDDGTSIYKLTDFGTARELEEGEQFQSIMGTEEYLHPDMYKRAFISRQMKNFDGTIDLWSLGVTLYHAATGNLPFQPYGGRRNRDKTAMYKIISQKESGIISGIQSEPNGKVCYRKELPEKCLMSKNLKKIITPLLSGLMEADESKTWNFNQFFDEVDKILSRTTIHIFHKNLIILYMPLGYTFEAFQDSIKQASGIEKPNQILIFKNCMIDSFNISDLLTTTQETPLFLFDKNSYKIPIFDESNFSFDAFPKESVDADANHCQILCKDAYQCKRKIDKYAFYSKLINEAVENLTNYINFELDKTLQRAKHISEKSSILQIIGKFGELEDKTKIENIIASLQTYQQQSSLKICWNKLTEDVDRLQILPSKVKAATYIDLLKKSLQQFQKNKSTTLSQNELKFHFLEKAKVNDLLKTFINLLENEIYPLYKKLAQNFSDWYENILEIIINIDSLRNDVGNFEQKVEKHQEQLKSSIRPILKEYENEESCQQLIERHYRLADFFSRQIDIMNCLIFNLNNC